MATRRENLIARLDAVFEELAALSPDKAGGKPNRTGAGVNVDHAKHKAGLYAEAAELQKLIQVEEVREQANAGNVGIVETEEWA